MNQLLLELDAVDFTRFATQREKVLACLRLGGAWTVPEIIRKIGGGTETGISARVRELRNPKYGGHDVRSGARQGAARGVYEYWLADSVDRYR